MSHIQAPQSGPKVAVLIAEDNLLNQRIIVRMVRSLGYTVDAVATGIEALEALQRRHYDIVLMDIRMPDMNGLEATRLIRAQLPASQQPRVYALTAGIGPEEHQACYDVGMDGFVAKPVVLEQLALLFSAPALKGTETNGDPV
jgi:CheY-like chemotaxis protein